MSLDILQQGVMAVSPTQARTVELSVSSRSELRHLRLWLESHRDIRVSAVSGQPATGELGTLDAILITAVSGSIMAVIRTIPKFIQARKSGMSVTLKVEEGEFTITGEDSVEVIKILENMLND